MCEKSMYRENGEQVVKPLNRLDALLAENERLNRIHQNMVKEYLEDKI